jgi:hypothetical protein
MEQRLWVQQWRVTVVENMRILCHGERKTQMAALLFPDNFLL